MLGYRNVDRWEQVRAHRSEPLVRSLLQLLCSAPESGDTPFPSLDCATAGSSPDTDVGIPSHALAPLGALLSLLVSLSGCGPRDAAYNPSHFRLRGPFVPAEAVLPRGAKPGAEIDGIYVAGDDSLTCCLIAPHASLLVRKEGPASKLCINVYVPEEGPFLKRAQSLSISLDRVPGHIALPNLVEGPDERCVPIPAVLRMKRGEIAVRLDSGIDYVPSKAGVSGDTEHYGLVLLSIYFE